MKKKLAYLLLFTCFSIAATGQTAADLPMAITTASFGLTGPVVSVIEKQYSFTDRMPQFSSSKTVFFDNSGRVDTITELKAGDKEPTTSAFTYNEAGQLLSVVILNGDKGYDSASFVYNRTGKLRRKILFDKGKCYHTAGYNYRNGKLSYIRNEDGNARLINMIRFRYNGKTEYSRIVFDEQLKLASSQLFMVKKDSQDSKQWSCYNYIMPDSCSGMENKIYDAHGNLTEDIITGPDKRVTSYTTNTYNDNGTLAGQTVFTGSDKKVTGYTYKFDEKGNWTEKGAYANGSAEMIISRTVRYADTKESRL